MEQVDAQLWSYSRDAFLPHGMMGQGSSEAQLVLLSETAKAANGARNIALIDGNWREEALAFERAFHFFDEARITDARAAWKALGGRDGVERRYWKQTEAGRWQQAA